MKPRVWCMLVGVLLVVGQPAAQAGQFGDFTCESSGTAVTITKYTGPGGDVTIPDTIEGLPVSSVGYQAFRDCVSLTGVAIPNSVTSIGEAAFFRCAGLTNIRIPNSVTSIGPYAFLECSSLTSITIPNSVTSIEFEAFRNCTGLTSVRIPNSVTMIASGAFGGCTSLSSITIPRSVTAVQGPGMREPGAFGNCTSLIASYFEGDAPPDDRAFASGEFSTGETPTTVYYLPRTTGWGPEYGGRSTALWQPRMDTGGAVANQFGFTISWASDRSVIVESCTDFANPTWSPVGTNALTDGSAYYTDPDWAQYPARFYRVRGE